ncbi:MAG TPA: heme ABC exporter ATP-binding protein CcmA [Hyphomicrobiaceae bacterium]|nr:heme ABC exporter ATP-binding protein CcmA [Hyphomicrobiaceae bacterium]
MAFAWAGRRALAARRFRPFRTVMQLIAENVSIGRGERMLFGPCSFRVEAGRALEVTGPNGSGKSTLLKTLVGFVAPLGGRIRLEGASTAHPIAEQCHYLGHRDAVRGTLTVGENVRFWCRFLGGSDGAHEAAVERFGLSGLAHVPAAYLSAGQRRRLALTRLLAAERPLWLLDEPAASLDAAGTEVLRQVMAAHLAKGGLLIAATHVTLALPAAIELRLGDGAGTA